MVERTNKVVGKERREKKDWWHAFRQREKKGKEAGSTDIQ